MILYSIYKCFLSQSGSSSEKLLTLRTRNEFRHRLPIYDLDPKALKCPPTKHSVVR